MIGGILVLFIYKTRLASNEIFSPLKKIHREVGRTKDLSTPLYLYRCADKSLARPGRKLATATEDFDSLIITQPTNALIVCHLFLNHFFKTLTRISGRNNKTTN